MNKHTAFHEKYVSPIRHLTGVLKNELPIEFSQHSHNNIFIGHFTFIKALIFIHLLKNIYWVLALCKALPWTVQNQTRPPGVYSLVDGGDKTEWNQIIADCDKCYEGGG